MYVLLLAIFFLSPRLQRRKKMTHASQMDLMSVLAVYFGYLPSIVCKTVRLIIGNDFIKAGRTFILLHGSLNWHSNLRTVARANDFEP